ncbi:hypothetical protein IQ62_38160 [Streptomyces scabiei]|nr:hypothetical protein IQ62_38160 [Streptomyces scabiei]
MHAFGERSENLSLLGGHFNTDTDLFETLAVGHTLLSQSDPCFCELLVLLALWCEVRIREKVIRSMDASHVP